MDRNLGQEVTHSNAGRNRRPFPIHALIYRRAAWIKHVLGVSVTGTWILDGDLKKKKKKGRQFFPQGAHSQRSKTKFKSTVKYNQTEWCIPLGAAVSGAQIMPGNLCSTNTFVFSPNRSKTNSRGAVNPTGENMVTSHLSGNSYPKAKSMKKPQEHPKQMSKSILSSQRNALQSHQH